MKEPIQQVQQTRKETFPSYITRREFLDIIYSRISFCSGELQKDFQLVSENSNSYISQL